MVSVLRFEIRVGQTWSGSSRAKSCAKHPIPKGCTCCRRDRVGGQAIRAANQSGLRVETGFSRKPRQHRAADDQVPVGVCQAFAALTFLAEAWRFARAA